MNTVRFGIIGAGGIAHAFHLSELAQIPEAELVAVADQMLYRAESTAEKFGARFAYDDYRRLLQRDDIDAVIVATYHPTHAPIGTEVIRAGKHLLVQKPMATTVEDANRLLAAYEDAKGAVRVMALPFVHRSTFRAIAKAVQDGAVGVPVMARLRVGHTGPDATPDNLRKLFGSRERESESWFLRRERSGAGVTFDLGVYAITELVVLLGPVTRVTGVTTNVQRDISVEENAVALLEFESGAVGVVETSWTQQAGDEHLSLYGTGGTLYSRGDRLRVFSKGEANGWTDRDVPDDPPAVTHRHFVHALLRGDTPIGSPYLGRHVVEIMEGILAAADTGRRVEISSRPDDATGKSA